MILTEQITALQEQLAAAQGQAQENYRLLGIASAAQEASAAAVLTLTAERDEARTSLATMTGERDTAVNALAAERESRETAINTEVTTRIAAAGGDPIKRDTTAIKSEVKSDGGKLTGLAKARSLLAEQMPDVVKAN
jgi:hypothetical protein